MLFGLTIIASCVGLRHGRASQAEEEIVLNVVSTCSRTIMLQDELEKGHVDKVNEYFDKLLKTQVALWNALNISTEKYPMYREEILKVRKVLRERQLLTTRTQGLVTSLRPETIARRIIDQEVISPLKVP
jgi:hypothetical protein